MITFDVRRYNSIDSTNDQALRLACQGAPHGTVVCAREQTAGRGRQAKHWYSPRGNLYVSIMLRLHLAPDRIAPVGFVAALAVADAADAFLPNDVRTELKWPNDVLIRGAKVSGILIEFTQAATVVGIGMNVPMRHQRRHIQQLPWQCAVPEHRRPKPSFVVLAQVRQMADRWIL